MRRSETGRLPSRPSGCDEPGVVREHDQLGPVARAELEHEAARSGTQCVDGGKSLLSVRVEPVEPTPDLLHPPELP